MKLHMNDILFMLIELVSFTNHIYCILFRFRGVVSASVCTSDHLCLMWCILPCCIYEKILLIINVLRIEAPLCLIYSYLELLYPPTTMWYASDPLLTRPSQMSGSTSVYLGQCWLVILCHIFGAQLGAWSINRVCKDIWSRWALS